MCHGARAARCGAELLAVLKTSPRAHGLDSAMALGKGVSGRALAASHRLATEAGALSPWPHVSRRLIPQRSRHRALYIWQRKERVCVGRNMYCADRGVPRRFGPSPCFPKAGSAHRLSCELWKRGWLPGRSRHGRSSIIGGRRLLQSITCAQRQLPSTAPESPAHTHLRRLRWTQMTPRPCCLALARVVHTPKCAPHQRAV